MEVNAVVVKRDVAGYGHDTENVATFGTRFPFTEFTTDRMMQRMCSVAPPGYKETDAAKIAQLQGVTKVCNYSSSDSTYDVIVKKATAFTWEELEPVIVQILTERHNRLSGKQQAA